MPNFSDNAKPIVVDGLPTTFATETKMTPIGIKTVPYIKRDQFSKFWANHHPKKPDEKPNVVLIDCQSTKDTYHSPNRLPTTILTPKSCRKF